jgi:sugar O-acyltransferase (sialic acid O-acetyltransferase NeuD family)
MKNKEVVIIGYSGHSFGCIEVAIKQGFLIVGYHDVLEKVCNPYNLEYFGHENTITLKNKAFIAIGDNNIRKKIYKKLHLKDISLNTILVHPDSTISKTSLIEAQTFISAGVIINPQVKIGVGCIINTGAILEHECIVNDFTHIAPGAVLCGSVTVGSNSFIGANAVIKQGIKIGNNVIIGAGSVVTADILEPGTYVGSPAKPLK